MIHCKECLYWDNYPSGHGRCKKMSDDNKNRDSFIQFQCVESWVEEVFTAAEFSCILAEEKPLVVDAGDLSTGQMSISSGHGISTDAGLHKP